jgi:hypothetical protein
MHVSTAGITATSRGEWRCWRTTMASILGVQCFLAREAQMMIKALMLTSALASGVAICVPADASARTIHVPRERGYYGNTYKPPAGQIWQRAYRNGITREVRARQDFQLDGAYDQ